MEELKEQIEAAQGKLRLVNEQAKSLRELIDKLSFKLTEKQLVDAGITPLETRVEYESWHDWIGPFYIERVLVGGGLRLCKIKKDGTPSKAGTGIWGHVSIDHIRKAEAPQ